MQRYEVEISRGKAGALMAAYVVVGLFMAVAGVQFWQQSEGDTAGRAFVAVWVALAILFFIMGFRQLRKRRLTTWLPKGMRPSKD